MAWGPPPTFTALTAPTAGNMNILRDCLLESAPAKAAAAGDLFYATGANAIARLPKGTDGQVLTVASGLPSWEDPTNSVIESVQSFSGSTTVSNGYTGNVDITITSVNASYAVVNVRSFGGTPANGGIAARFSVQSGPSLAGSTTVRFVVTGNSGNGASTLYYDFDVVEFKSDKVISLQQLTGSIAVGNLFTGNKDVTVSSVDVAKTIHFQRMYGSDSSDVYRNGSVGTKFILYNAGKLTSSTNLRFVIAANSGNGDSTLYYAITLVELL